MNFTQYLDFINDCDSTDPLLSETELGKHLETIPLDSVTLNLEKFYQSLDRVQLIKTENGLARDFRGLGQLMGFTSIEIESRFANLYRPTYSLVESYINRNFMKDCSVTVKDLLNMLEQLERFDIIDDALPFLVGVVQSNINNRANSSPQSNGQLQNGGAALALCEPAVSGTFDSQPSEKLTIDDVNDHRIMYDAFVCFAIEDYSYAQELISLLEEDGRRVATANDLLAVQYEHDALIKLIDRRCRKVLTVLTPNFLRSKECEFQTKFASEIAIKSGGSSPKIVPILFEPCDDSQLPYMIRVISKIDMTDRGAHRWQIKKLLRSLDDHPSTNSRKIHPESYATRSRQESHHEQPRGSQYSPNYPGVQIDQISGDPEPVIELATSANTSYSHLSVSTKPESRQQDYPQNSMTACSVSRPLSGLFKQVKRRVLGQRSAPGHQNTTAPSPTPSYSSVSSISPSTSSQAVLLNSNSSTEIFIPSNRDK